MLRQSRIRKREQSGADKTTLGLFVLLLVAVFLALTFGEAEGVVNWLR